MHGDECESTVVLSEALRSVPEDRLATPVILNVNPDGTVLGTRANARGVDLNRNWPTHNWTADAVYYKAHGETVRDIASKYPDTFVLEDTDLMAADPATSVPAIRSDQLVAIVFTSGSTGESTGHPKYWETIHGGALANRVSYGLGEGRINMLATVPPQHNWGLETSVLLPLVADIAVSGETPLFPQDIADALNRLPEPRALVSSPIHLDSLLQSGISGIRVDRILSATAPMSAQLARQLESRFGAHVNEVFGCTEAGSLASRATASP